MFLQFGHIGQVTRQGGSIRGPLRLAEDFVPVYQFYLGGY